MAGINALSRLVGAQVVTVDMGVAADLSSLVAAGKITSKRIAAGTANMAVGPAMTRPQAERAIEAGIEGGRGTGGHRRRVGTGDMGIANTTPSTAVVAALTGAAVPELTGSRQPASTMANSRIRSRLWNEPWP